MNLENSPKVNNAVELSFSRSFGFSNEEASNGVFLGFEKARNIDSSEIFLGATTRRKLLEESNFGEVLQPKEDEPVQFSVRDNRELEILAHKPDEILRKSKGQNYKRQTFELSAIKLEGIIEKGRGRETIERSAKIWKTNFFIIVYLVSLFLSKMKRSSVQYMRKKLANRHYSMLEDKSYFPIITKKTIDQKTIEMMRNQNYFLSELRKSAVK